jgi:predicted metal-dependent hydrolase
MKFFKIFKRGIKKKGKRGITSFHRDYFRNKERARKLIMKRLDYFSQKYNFRFNKVSIRNQKTRWGSCSKKGNLNFNYRLIYLPQRQIDYIIVHELCHLKYLNHSKKFWNLVGKIIPNYREVRKELRQNCFN